MHMSHCKCMLCSSWLLLQRNHQPQFLLVDCVVYCFVQVRTIPKQSAKPDLSTFKALPHVPCRGHVKSTEPTGTAEQVAHASVAAVACQEEQLLTSAIKPALDISRTSSPKGAITNCLETTLQSSGSHLKRSRAEHSEVCPIVSFSIDSVSKQQDSGERPTGLEGEPQRRCVHYLIIVPKAVHNLARAMTCWYKSMEFRHTVVLF
jgi:hypothetical protein